MQRTFILLFLLFFTACSNHALEVDEKSELLGLQNALNEYTDATINNKIDKLTTFVYPKVFTIVSPEKMVYLLQRIYASGKAPKITKITHKDISGIQHYEDGIYSIILSDMYMELASPTVNNPEYEMLLYATLKKKMGAESIIHFDRDQHIYRIKKDSKIIGIKEREGNWKFVGYEQAKKYASQNIIPKEISLLLE